MKTLKNEFIKIRHCKKDKLVYIGELDKNGKVETELVLTEIEFDNLTHLIADNYKLITDEFCHLPKKKDMTLEDKIKKYAK